MKALAAALFLTATSLLQAALLDVEARLEFGGKPLSFDTLAWSLGDRRISITRCDLLLSGAALQKENGEWIGANDWSAFINGRMDRTRFSLGSVPPGKYTKLKFAVGLPKEMNLGDPSVHPAGHPLNPAVNGMHWGWQGGYIFAAIEGMWKAPDSPLGGYSFHLANEGNLATVELSAALDLTRDQTLEISLDLSTVFSGIVITHENAATHSREGDPIAPLLRGNFSRAFKVRRISPTPTRREVASLKKTLIADDASPFRFSFSSSFPRPQLPTDNPLTREGVELGRELFHDDRLSGNGTQSCASCHHPPLAFSDRRRFSIGAFGDIGKRQSMPLTNLAWKTSFFWDGRATKLRQQVLMPIEDRTEMHASLSEVVRRLDDDKDYREMFKAAFGSTKIDEDRIARALEQFLLTLVSDESKFDRAMRGEDELTDEEKLGARLFNTEYDPARGLRGADCFHCHGGPLFQSTAFANNGLDGSPPDLGKMKVTRLEGDRGKFAVPSLRNVALTAPYMHDGRFASLEEVIDHYDHGLKRNATLDPNLAKHPDDGLKLTPEEKSALVAFLKTLTDDTLPRPPRRMPPPRRPPPPPR